MSFMELAKRLALMKYSKDSSKTAGSPEEAEGSIANACILLAIGKKTST